jgi:thioredoxin 1
MPIEITEANYESEVDNSDIPVILDVYATWCGPCKITKPIFVDLAKDYVGKVKFALLNTDQQRNIAIKFGITSIPAFIFIKNGEALGKIIGGKSRDELQEFIDSHLS